MVNFHGGVTFILEPKVAKPFLDDTVVKFPLRDPRGDTKLQYHMPVVLHIS